MFRPLLILDSVDKTAKIFRRSCWIEDLKYVFISDALHNVFILLENAKKMLPCFLCCFFAVLSAVICLVLLLFADLIPD